MKKLLLLFTLFTGIALNSQYVEQEVIVEEKLTVGTSDLPTGNSVLEVGDTLGGVKFPRFTQTQIDNLSLSNADTALMLYNLTDSVYQFYDGDTWGNMQGGATLYSSNGTLSGARTVDHNGNTLTFSNGKAVFSSTDNGIQINEVTTAQMNAISTPVTNELVFNTDLEGLYRYDGANWVALAAGLGVIGVITDADNGTPTYYADLQSALETCKTSGSNNTVTLYSDVTLSSELSIKYGGTGIGNAYDYNSLTINLNGFKITYDNASSDNAMSVILGNSSSNNCTLTLLNGQIERTSGTGTHQALEVDGDGNLTMSGMVIYNDNSQATEIINQATQTYNGSINDFGNSTFVSNASSGYACGFMAGRNFRVISLGNADGFRVSGAHCWNVYVKCYGTGNAINNGGNLYNSYIETNSGIAINGSGKYYHCNIKSSTGYICRNNSAELHYCFGETGDSEALYTVPLVSHSTIINNSSSDLIRFSGKNRKSTFINKGSGKVVDINSDTRIFEDCELISVGGVPVTTSGDCNGKLQKCLIESQWDNTNGHAVSLGHSSNTLFLSNCILEVVNASANCLYSGSARNVSIGNSALNGATTPINANVTVSLTSAPDSNGNYTN